MTTRDLAGDTQHTGVGATADRSRAEQVLSECRTHGFDYRKNSSGFGGEATIDRVRFVAYRVGGSVGVKAGVVAGPVTDARTPLLGGVDLLGGADRLATSSGGETLTGETSGDGY